MVIIYAVQSWSHILVVTIIFMLRYILTNKFCISKSLQKIMIFASHPVGFPVVKTLSDSYSFHNISVVTHYTPSNQRLKNQVEALCREKGIKVYHPMKKGQNKEEREIAWRKFEEEVRQDGKGQWPSLGIVCSYGYMIPGTVLSSFTRGAFLAHPSLVPKYRGGSPIFHTIANGQKESGVSYMEISPQKFDQGNVLHQVTHPLGEHDSYEKVEHDLSNLAAKHIHYVIENFDSLRPGQDQSTMNVSGIPQKLLKSPIVNDKRLKIQMPAEDVYNWSRALMAPKVQFKGEEIIIIFQKKFQEDPNNSYQAGQVVILGNKIYMKCLDRLILLKGWQQLKKKPLPIHTFINRFIPDKKTYQNDLYFS